MASNASLQEEKLWEAWLNNQDSDAANVLIQKHEHLVNFHTQRIAVYLPNSVSKDDIKSLGLMGLYDAMKKFDPARDLKFDTYASFRIRGAILDGLRKEDWLPRSVRERAKKVEQVSQDFEQTYQRTPTSAEIGEQLNISEKEVEEIVKDSLFSNVLSIEEKPKASNNQHNEGIGYTIPDNSAFSPDHSLIMKEDYGELAHGIKKLNKNEQMVISLFYNEELTLTEIGHVLGLTTSRISQIHRKAIFNLKNHLSQLQKI